MTPLKQLETLADQLRKNLARDVETLAAWSPDDLLIAKHDEDNSLDIFKATTLLIDKNAAALDSVMKVIKQLKAQDGPSPAEDPAVIALEAARKRLSK